MALRPAGEQDPVVEAYKQGIDRTLLRQNLERTVAERLTNLVALQRLAEEARRARRNSGAARIAELEALLEERDGR